MAKYHFTTVVSQDHFFKLLAMISSLQRHARDFKLFVACAHDVIWNILNSISFPDVVPVRLGEIEDQRLLAAKSRRSFHEYCWTLKPVFLHYIMTKYPEAQYYAHLDADLFFFDSPENIFNERPDATLFLTHHRNSRDFLEYYGKTGVFNTGFVGCKNEMTALTAVTQWKERCIAYCSVQEDHIRKLFGDQRYVETWPDEFQGVYVVQSPGVNTALWNIPNYTVSLMDGKVMINDSFLTFYHFSGLVIISRQEFNLNWYYHIDDQIVLEHIYKPYVTALTQAMKEMHQYFPWFQVGFIPKEYTPNTHYYRMEPLN